MQVKANPKSDDADDAAFGFSDSTGRHILLFDTDRVADPSKFTMAVSGSTKSVPSVVAFIKKSKATVNDNGRQTIQNFDHNGGFLFMLKSGFVDTGYAVVLLSPKFTSGRKYIKVNEVTKQGLSNSLKLRFEAAKGRKVKSFKELAKLNGNRLLYLIEFEAKCDSVLVSLVWVTDHKIVYKDYPAKYDRTSTWSVDDGGEFGMDEYHIIALFEREGSLEIITEHLGTESDFLEFMEESGQSFKVIKEGSRYIAPV